MRLLPLVFGAVLSPTRLAIHDLKSSRDDPAPLLWCWNSCFFWYEFAVCLSLALHPFVLPTVALPVGLMLVLLWLAGSLCNEITYAFYADTIDQLNGKRKTSLTLAQRIQMAVRIYLGLTANFGIICFLLPTLYDPACVPSARIWPANKRRRCSATRRWRKKTTSNGPRSSRTSCRN